MAKEKKSKRTTSLAKVGTFLVATSSMATAALRHTNIAVAEALGEATFGEKKPKAKRRERRQRRKTKKGKRQRRKTRKRKRKRRRK